MPHYRNLQAFEYPDLPLQPGLECQTLEVLVILDDLYMATTSFSLIRPILYDLYMATTSLGDGKLSPINPLHTQIEEPP